MTEVRIRTTRGSVELSYQPDDKNRLLKAHRSAGPQQATQIGLRSPGDPTDARNQ
jgi:hypothetical protein